MNVVIIMPKLFLSTISQCLCSCSDFGTTPTMSAITQVIAATTHAYQAMRYFCFSLVCLKLVICSKKIKNWKWKMNLANTTLFSYFFQPFPQLVLCPHLKVDLSKCKKTLVSNMITKINSGTGLSDNDLLKHRIMNVAWLT